MPPARKCRSVALASSSWLPSSSDSRGRPRCGKGSADADAAVNRAIIVESVRDAEGGIESLPEREFDLLRRQLRLPEPSRQRVMRRRDGRYFLDNEWPDFGVRTEIHGIPHSEIRQWDDDLLRQNDISIDGGLLVFSSYGIRHLQSRVGGQLLSMFRRRGWRG